MEIGPSQQSSVEVTPSNATDQSVTWHTTDAEVLTVNANGVVTAVGLGNANVKARAEDGTVLAIKTVRVRAN